MLDHNKPALRMSRPDPLDPVSRRKGENEAKQRQNNVRTRHNMQHRKQQQSNVRITQKCNSNHNKAMQLNLNQDAIC